MLDDETISLLSAHARAQSLLARLRAKDADCRVWLAGGVRRMEERVDRVEILVSGEMPLSEADIGPGFGIAVVEAGEEGWALVESTGGDGFLAEMEEVRLASGLPWPLPDTQSERELVMETFGQPMPPWLRSDQIDRSDPPRLAGDMLVVPRMISASSAKEEVVGYLDAIGGSVFVADDGGSVASLLAMLGERMDNPRIRLSTVVPKASKLDAARGGVVILDASAMSGEATRVCGELEKLREATDKPILLFNPTGRKPSNDMRGKPEEVETIAARCAEIGCPVLVCGHLARLSPGDAEAAIFLRAGCYLALGSGGNRPDRCRFGLAAAAAMAARAGAKPRDIWKSDAHS